MLHTTQRLEDAASIYGREIFSGIAVPENGFGIEEYLAAVNAIEGRTGIDFVRLDFGVPGLMPLGACISGHTAPLQAGIVPQQYPPAAGIERLRSACAEFVSSKLDIECNRANVFVSCGGTQALYIAQTIAASIHPERRAAVFLTPAYPPMFAQARLLGMDVRPVELDGLHGVQLILALEAAFAAGDVASLCWASPNNPTWSIRTAEELRAIAALCARYDVLPIEDLTYLGMASGAAGESVRLPSIAQYAARYFIVLSASKMLSYAGERVGFLIGSQTLLVDNSTAVARISGVESIERSCSSMIFNISAGAPHSAQHGVAQALEAINEGKLDLERVLAVYADRARQLKQILLENGFYLIYDDEARRAADGFYVCFGYPNVSGNELLRRLLVYGVTVLPLSLFGSTRTDGVRACVGRLDEKSMVLLGKRLTGFWTAPNTPAQAGTPRHPVPA